MSKDNNSAAKPKKEKKRRGNVFKETFSELKKVTWPSFSTVVKQTGIVLAVVLIFLVVLMCFDQLLGWLYKLLVKGLESGTDTTSALISGVLGLTSSGAGLPLWV